jgi:hypothetical protein
MFFFLLLFYFIHPPVDVERMETRAHICIGKPSMMRSSGPRFDIIMSSGVACRRQQQDAISSSSRIGQQFSEPRRD